MFGLICRIETEAKMEEIHEESNKFARGCDEEVPLSIGHYFREQFEKWLLGEKVKK